VAKEYNVSADDVQVQKSVLFTTSLDCVGNKSKFTPPSKSLTVRAEPMFRNCYNCNGTIAECSFAELNIFVALILQGQKEPVRLSPIFIIIFPSYEVCLQ
jgi:hypothetical protein